MSFMRNVLNEQRKRLVGSLMGYLEAEVYPTLSRDQQMDLRAKVLAAVAQYHDVCLDMLKASVDEGTAVNEEAVRVMDRVTRELHLLRTERDG